MSDAWWVGSAVARRSQTRILLARDLAAKHLASLMESPNVAGDIKLAAARDLLDRANLSGRHNVEVSVTKRSFDDVLDELLVEVEEDDDSPPPILSAPSRDYLADVVDDELDGEPPVKARHDRALFAEVERGKRTARSLDADEIERRRAASEGALVASEKANRERAHAAYLEALEAGLSQREARVAADAARSRAV